MSDSHEPFFARDPNLPPRPGQEWERNGRASDIPIEPGDEPSPFADLDEVPPEEFADRVPPEVEPYSDSDIGARKVTVTFITNKSGQYMRRVDMTLPQLAEHIRFQTATRKFALPWLKFAVFGNKRSKKKSLRTNENVLQISGIEVEHDAGDISFDTALATVLSAGIRCILYTSPSHVPGEKERWRILVPLSQNREPGVREKFVARVNGLFAGKLAGESFTLSQGFLYGSVNKSPHHRVELIDGRFLDRRDDLYAGSIFKDGSKVGGNSSAAGPDFNGAGPQSRSRKDDDPGPIDINKIEAALNVISSDCPYKVWLKVGGALHSALGEAGFERFDRWSAKAVEKKYNADECKEKWHGIRSLTEHTAATLFFLADEADPTWKQRYEDEEARRTFERMAAAAGASSGAGTSGAGAGTGNTGNSSNGAGTSAGTASPQPPLIPATPYVWIDPAKIPQRDWLYGRLLIRKFVTATVAPGGIGKSSLITVETLSQVSGMDLIGVTPKEQLRVWLWNLEDPQEETGRKIQAAAKHYGLKPEDIGHRLFVDSGRDRPLVIATMSRNGPMIVRPVVDGLVAEIIRLKIDVIVIDPFVSSHELPENDNTAQDMAVKEWGRVADWGNCAVHLVDHTRKMGSETEVTTESSRGGKAKTDAARVVRVVNRMTEDQGEKAGVDNHRLYFRTYNDKANLAPPADKSDWFELKSVDLGNGPGMEVNGVSFNAPGDGVGVVKPWAWPDPLAGMTGQDFEKVATVIRRGEWRADFRAKAWVGHAVAEAMGLDAGIKKDRAKISGMLGVWLVAGSLIIVERPDEHRELKKFVEVKEDDA